MDTNNAVGCECSPGKIPMGKCSVEAIINIDDRGQMILPKSVRQKMNINPEDKLIIISWEKDGKVDSLTMMKNDEFSEMIKNHYS